MRRDKVRVNLYMPKAWAEMADQLALMTGQSRLAYLKDALIRQMMEDWALVPGRGFWLRPNTPVYKLDDGVFRPVARSMGGERVWPLEQVGRFPAALGGELAFRVDVVNVGTDQGLTMTDVVVGRDRFGGPAVAQ